MGARGALSADDDLKLCYGLIRLAPNKAKMAEVATFMGLKEGATHWRYNALMKKCKEKFGDIGGGAMPTGSPNENHASPAGPKVIKRKRGKADESHEETSIKKIKGEDEHKSDDEGKQVVKSNVPGGSYGQPHVKEESHV